MVGNNRRLCSALTCLRTVEIECADGGASTGTGVDRPLGVLARSFGVYEEAL
jgi:hypothetical protein